MLAIVAIYGESMCICFCPKVCNLELRTGARCLRLELDARFFWHRLLWSLIRNLLPGVPGLAQRVLRRAWCAGNSVPGLRFRFCVCDFDCDFDCDDDVDFGIRRIPFL